MWIRSSFRFTGRSLKVRQPRHHPHGLQRLGILRYGAKRLFVSGTSRRERSLCGPREAYYYDQTRQTSGERGKGDSSSISSLQASRAEDGVEVSRPLRALEGGRGQCERGDHIRPVPTPPWGSSSRGKSRGDRRL
jgi:hypothetical protein